MTGAVHEIRDEADLGIDTLNQRAMVWRSNNVRPSRVSFGSRIRFYLFLDRKRTLVTGS
jgi:hypothetical protein